MLWLVDGNVADPRDLTYVFSRNHVGGLLANDWNSDVRIAQILDPMAKWIGDQQQHNDTPNTALINYYPDGKSSVAKHTDDDKWYGESFFIASYTVGAARDFLYWLSDENTGTPVRHSITLAHGDLLIMHSSVAHAVPVRKRCTEPRYNITFRTVHPHLIGKMPKAKSELAWQNAK